jgi:hypothetical protein
MVKKRSQVKPSKAKPSKAKPSKANPSKAKPSQAKQSQAQAKHKPSTSQAKRSPNNIKYQIHKQRSRKIKGLYQMAGQTSRYEDHTPTATKRIWSS